MRGDRLSGEPSASGPELTGQYSAPGTVLGPWMISASGLCSGALGLLIISLHSGRAVPGSVIFGESLNHTVTQSKPAGKPDTAQAPGKPAVAPNWPFSAKSPTALEGSTRWGELDMA